MMGRGRPRAPARRAWASRIRGSGSPPCTARAQPSCSSVRRVAEPGRRCVSPSVSWSPPVGEIRALIVDDEPLARRGIRQLLAPHADIVVVGECRDGREAVRALVTEKPDLVFLDVQMPGLDGLGVIRVHGVERMPVTVFITAHDQFAVSAFEAHALDYLVKPLSESRFRATLAR